MSLSMILFIIFLVINLILTVVYLIVSLFFRNVDRHLAWYRAVVMLLAPGVGILFILLGRFGYNFVFRTDVDLSDVIFSKEHEKEIVKTDIDVERNIVPIEEAITITNKSELRGLVMGVAQGECDDYLASIALALNCSDSETAHYAASILQDALNDFRLEVSKGYNIVKKRDENLEKVATGLLEYMDKILRQNVFSPVEQRSFSNTMENIAEILYEEIPEAITSEICENVCLRLLEVKSYEKCEKWCLRSKEMFPNELASFSSRLKLYFNSERKEDFFATLEELKASPVIIDSETLELIRAFS